jgi:hypothetical protein
VSPPLSFGGLFRRKEKKSTEVSQGAARTRTSAVNDNTSNRITISNALDLLEKMENEKVGDMSGSYKTVVGEFSAISREAGRRNGE